MQQCCNIQLPVYMGRMYITHNWTCSFIQALSNLGHTHFPSSCLLTNVSRFHSSWVKQQYNMCCVNVCATCTSFLISTCDEYTPIMRELCINTYYIPPLYMRIVCSGSHIVYRSWYMVCVNNVNVCALYSGISSICHEYIISPHCLSTMSLYNLVSCIFILRTLLACCC